jgi:TonB family protein
VPVGLVLGGVGVLFLLVFAAGAIFFLKNRGGAAASPAPVVEASAPETTAPTPVPETGVLSIETQPAGAAITVNGEPRGVAPLEIANLGVGNYDVRAELKGYDAKSETATITTASLRADVRLTLARIAPVGGLADVVSTPAGAAVTVDGAASGQTPVTDLKLRPGAHKVELSKDGYEPWSGNLSVDPGKKARLEATLKAVPPKVTQPPKPEADPNHVYDNTAADVDVQAKRVSGSSAEYPSRGVPNLKSGQSVSVSLNFIVTETGQVDDIKVVESAGKVIDDAVVSAVRQWKYSPATKQGQAVKVRIRFKQTFQAG